MDDYKNRMDLFQSFSRALILCPHTDDEQGCAGTVCRLISSNVQVKYVALSRCEASVPEGLPQDILEKECRSCVTRLGIKPDMVEIWNFEVRYFPQKRQEILEKLCQLSRSYQPDLVLLPSSMDTHQDHSTIFHEGFRAFKSSTILGYELPQNLITFENSAFVSLTNELMQKKIHALSAYKSQNFRPFTHPEFINSLAKVRGVQCNAEYAEAFEVIKLIV